MIFLSLWVCVISGQITYNMRNQGITSMLNHSIPANTTCVWFQQNSITNVPAGYFRNLSNVESINLENNLISEIDAYAFSGVPSVRKIDLYKNKLTVIRKMMFYGTPNLENLVPSGIMRS